MALDPPLRETSPAGCAGHPRGVDPEPIARARSGDARPTRPSSRTRSGRAFGAAFGRDDRGRVEIVRAPGRVNLIGEHTDYNQGLVLPVAIDLEVRIARRRRADRRVRIVLAATGETAELDLDRIGPRTGAWIDYVAGTALEMAAAGLADRRLRRRPGQHASRWPRGCRRRRRSSWRRPGRCRDRTGRRPIR